MDICKHIKVLTEAVNEIGNGIGIKDIQIVELQRYVNRV